MAKVSVDLQSKVFSQHHVEILRWPQTLKRQKELQKINRRVFLTLEKIQVPPTPFFPLSLFLALTLSC